MNLHAATTADGRDRKQPRGPRGQRVDEDDDLDMDPALRACVQPVLAGPHLVSPPEPERMLAAERPDAILPTVDGQTALNLAPEAGRQGILEKYGVELLGACLPAIEKARGALEQTSASRPARQMSATGHSDAPPWTVTQPVAYRVPARRRARARCLSILGQNVKRSHHAPKPPRGGHRTLADPVLL